MVSLFKKGVKLATREGRNSDGSFAALWKRRLSIMARKIAMKQQAHYALRQYLKKTTFRIMKKMRKQ